MNKPLSISAYNRFVTCPKQFYYHYIERRRPVYQPAHLTFGSAVDAGLNALLDESRPPMEACEEVLKKLVVEPIEFSKPDYDGELIDEKTKSVLLEKCQSFGYTGDDLDSLAVYLLSKPITSLSGNQRACLGLLCTATLKEKARLFFEAYKKKVLPLIKKTKSVQQQLRWEDDKGNLFVGVLDVVCELPGYGDVVLDNKTSSRPYDEDAVLTSVQLGLYTLVVQVKHAAYAVMDKNIKKNRIKICSVCGNNGTGKRHKTCDAEPNNVRCNGEWTESIEPEANIQLLVNEIPKRVGLMTQEALTETAELIKSGSFPRNLNACKMQYGRPCSYINYCWHGDEAGLVVEKKEEPNV